jgi:ribulose-phosphate 3-epimerase
MGKLAASILSADFAYLAEQVKLVEPHADLIHVDVMDAHFVPVLSIGPVVVESLRPVTGLPLHCHLMVDDPVGMMDELKEAGTDIVTAHVEAVEDPGAVTKAAIELGMKPGLAVNPSTPMDDLYSHLDELDRVLVMSVNPGWAGQRFIDDALRKIEEVRVEIDRRGLQTEIEVDGGINEETGARCIAAGATVLAAASSVFKVTDVAEAARRLAEVAHAEEPADG